MPYVLIMTPRLKHVESNARSHAGCQKKAECQDSGAAASRGSGEHRLSFRVSECQEQQLAGAVVIEHRLSFKCIGLGLTW